MPRKRAKSRSANRPSGPTIRNDYVLSRVERVMRKRNYGTLTRTIEDLCNERINEIEAEERATAPT